MLPPAEGTVGLAPAELPRRRIWRRLPDWSTLPPPDSRLEATVIVPVRNEATGLRATLVALFGQRERDGRRLDPRRFEVIVLANNCTDASAEVVRRFSAAHRSFRLHVVEVTFPRPLAHVGHARRVLMEAACQRLEQAAGERRVIASTDGDTRVAPDWLAQTLVEIDAGADAVGGAIELDGADRESAAMARLAGRDATYRRLLVRLEHALDPDPGDPWPRHHQHFGASLALTAGAYRQVGGLPLARFLEDEALYRALRQHDLVVRHSRRVRVVTSSRREGRVEVGLSCQMRAWAELAEGGGPDDTDVGDPRRYAEELALRRRCRAYWAAHRVGPNGNGQAHAALNGSGRDTAAAEHELQALGSALNTRPRWLAARMRASATFGTFWGEIVGRRMRVRPRPPASPAVTMPQAILLLRGLLADPGRTMSRPVQDRVDPGGWPEPATRAD